MEASGPQIWDLWDLEYVGIFICTKTNALRHFIDAYITELSATHRLVCSWQDNNDVMKSL